MPNDNSGPLRQFIRRLCLLILTGYLSVSTVSSAKSPVIAVLYPEAIRPYSTVFAEILDGITQPLGTADSHRYALSEHENPDTLKQWLERQSPDAVITLGRRAAHAYEETGLSIPQVIGALDVSPQTHPDVSGISLSIDPALLFSTLRLLLPKVEEVYVVFDPNRDRWIIDRARQAAARYQLRLHPFEASDLRTSAHHFWKILKTANPATDALWLTMDSKIIDDEAVLPVIIEQSWQRRLPVFSTNLMHVNRGVLFALYPDNEALGRHLAEMALRLATDPNDAPRIEPLREIKRALNRRISSHLDLAVDKRTEQQFDLVLQPR